MQAISDSQIVSAVRAVLPEVEAVYLYGSFATGEQNDSSDLDLAVVMPSRLNPLQLWDASNAMADKLNIDLDLLDLKAVDTVVQHQVLTTGRRIFGEGLLLDLYETYILSAMTSLEELRAPLIADIIHRGSVYAR